jgi:hypothetical protein
LDNRYQRTLATAPRLEQRRIVTAIAHPRKAQLDAAHPRIPGPIAIAVPLTTTISSSLEALSTEVLRHLNFHDLLRQHSHTLAQKSTAPFNSALRNSS